MTPFFDDDGTEVDPEMYPKPGLCLVCKKNSDASKEMLCDLNRLDQRYEKEFKCFAFEAIEKKKN